MNAPVELRPIPATAEEWFARRRAPDRSPEEDAAFEAWLAASPGNPAEYAECERFWRVPQGLRAQPDLAAQAIRIANLQPQARTRSRAGRWVAAAALAAGVTAVALHLAPIDVMNPGAVRTARGEQRVVALADGSTVQLNTDSVLIDRMNDRERRVELMRGEAFFDVVHEAARPFVVRAGPSEVRVVGTQFSVRETGGKFEVIVKQGVVNVIPDATRPASESDKVELAPGARLNYDNTQRLVKVANVDAERSLAWRKGMIELDRTPLSEAVEELNRYTEIQIAIEDPVLAAIPVSGGFRLGDTNAFIFALQERFDVKVARRGDRISLR